jgi:hypothetical protein
MRALRFFLAASIFISLAPLTRAGNEAVSDRLRSNGQLEAPTLEIAAESSYGLGSFGNPNSYEVGAEFITARLRWGINDRDTWMRGYHQVYFLAMAQPFFRGVENYYFGISTGFRYNFVQPGRRWNPYISSGVGLGWIDSRANVFGGQGQDFTFNILSAAGISYRLNNKLQLTVGALYEHFSNGGQTDPNTSLNLFGPQIGVTYAF